MKITYNTHDFLYALMKSRLTSVEYRLVILFMLYPCAELSYTDIQEITGLGCNSICRGLQTLVNGGVLQIVGCGERCKYIYRVNESWRDWWNNWKDADEK